MSQIQQPGQKPKERSGHSDFLKVNAIIIKACNPEASQRYQTVSEMLQELVAASLGQRNHPAPER